MPNFEKKQARDEEIQRMRNEIKTKEEGGEDVTEEKIAVIEKIYTYEPSEEERNGFDAWLAHMPENSVEKPIVVANIEEIERVLPQYSNYSGEKVNLFFTKEVFLPDELQAIMENFSHGDPAFEISITRHSDDLISIGIGDTLRNGSIIFDGEYFGHYHPTRSTLENKEELPDCFVAGLMPSAGDIKGFLKYEESVKGGTKIFSKNGYVFIKPLEEEGSFDQKLDEFKQNYFDLFLGENRLNLKSDEEVKEYFKENLGFDIDFHYFEQASRE
ncbi:hypothetical protein HY839_01250 [Candidatus Azambacteria bacterium]|nr:hypothetical protein [Candidatus Azambacteria bacterium]